jgi:hypothetical protein
MMSETIHQFHIPVMGLSFTLETPLKVARFGISSAVSVMSDQLLEDIRQHHTALNNLPFEPIDEKHPDRRAARITAYLNMLQDILDMQMEAIKIQAFGQGNDIDTYFELLPNNAPLKQKYELMLSTKGEARKVLETELRNHLIPGAVDVNIMTKVDKANNNSAGEPLPVEFSDALSAMRGFANSRLHASVILSAGLNPRLFNYMSQFDAFYPDASGKCTKKVILKVSDYRSAFIQGKMLAKKGIWVNEFRIESGLNCGGHAFATDGVLMGPVLEEFKLRRQELYNELFDLCRASMVVNDKFAYEPMPEQHVTAQGGIGTSGEHEFLLAYYNLSSTGWGSPFLLVPEATTVDDDTLQKLAHAKKEDFFLSWASPLGIPFNNFKSSSAEEQRRSRIESGRPGAPCTKKLLTFNSEFTKDPICTASREYQHKKLKAIEIEIPDEELRKLEAEKIMAKDCLCEGLGMAAMLKNKIKLPTKIKAVTICPGPNLAYFSGIKSLREMVDHIYGRCHTLNKLNRSHMFINELNIYIDYLRKQIDEVVGEVNDKQANHFAVFKENLLKSIDYYTDMARHIPFDSGELYEQMLHQLKDARELLAGPVFERASLPVRVA